MTLVFDESGATAIFIALIFSVICGFAALTIDVAHMVAVKAELQRAADAGALSGVLNVVPYTGSYPYLTPDWLTGRIDAANTVNDINNKADNQQSSITSSDVLSGYWLLNPQGMAQTLSPSRPLPTFIPAPAIRVTLTRSVAMLFAPIIGGNAVQDVTAAATAILPEASGITGAFAMAVNFPNVFNGTPASSGSIKTGPQTFGYGNGAQWYNQDGSDSVTSIRNNTQLVAGSNVYLVVGAKTTLYSLIQAGTTIMVPVLDPVVFATGKSYPIYAFVPFTVTGVSGQNITGNFVNKYISPGAVPTNTGGTYSGISGTPKLVSP